MELATKYKMVRTAEDLTIKRFAEICSLSEPNYNAIERGAPLTVKSQEKIERTIQKMGWTLLEDGVVKKERDFYIYEGDEAFNDLLDDIENTLNGRGELLAANVNEEKTPLHIVKRLSHIRATGVKMRHTIKRGDSYMRAPENEYKTIPERFYINQPILIFGNKVAMMHSEDMIIYVHNNAHMSQYFKRQFDVQWSLFDAPDMQSTAPKEARYEI